MAPVNPTPVPATATDVPTDIPPTATALPTATPAGQYRDGTYDGPITDAFYGNVQVRAVVQGGKIVDVQFLDYPQDRRTSQRINSIAMPYLTQEAIQVQSAYINIISGATLTSYAFAQSLDSALSQARTGL
ncbi:MAG: FMN-binding protein [Anaerolineae bacterium]